MPKHRIHVTRGETTISLAADREGQTFTFPAASLPYNPRANMGLHVNGYPVEGIMLTIDAKLDMVALTVGAEANPEVVKRLGRLLDGPVTWLGEVGRWLAGRPSAP